MIAPLTQNTQAILLLTAPLIAGRGEASRDLLSLGDYNRIARVLRDKHKQPADLLGPDGDELIGLCGQLFGRPRLEGLLGRGFLLSQALERWNARAIWVISRADGVYPKKVKTRLKEDAPPVLYGCGEIGLLETGGLAVVGSRQIDDSLTDYTVKVGRLAAESGRAVVSGGAKGIDRAAMQGGLEAGGAVVGVMADSLERAALSHDNREALMDGRLVLISPYDPAAGFNVGHAMQRNKLIYALADAALVVTSDFQKGGTWTGAIEQLERLHYVPLFVRNGGDAGKGNMALLHQGAHRWPEPRSAEDLNQAISGALTSLAAQPKQDTFALPLRADVSLSSDSVVVTPVVETIRSESVNSNSIETSSISATELLKVVRTILQRDLVEGKTEEEVAQSLAVTKAQAKAWMVQLVAEDVLEKINKSKPPRYRTLSGPGRLL